MANLSEKDLALLSALMYCNYVVEQDPGTKLIDVVEKLLGITKGNIIPDDLHISGDVGNIRGAVEKEVTKKIEKISLKLQEDTACSYNISKNRNEYVERFNGNKQNVADNIAKEVAQKAGILKNGETDEDLTDRISKVVREDLSNGIFIFIRYGIQASGEEIGKIAGEYAAAKLFREALMAIQSSKALRELTIVKSTKREEGEINDVSAACFANGDIATVAFRGTDGSGIEWADNFAGGVSPATLMQNAAKDFIDGLPSEYQNITVTGHSKGGNMAAYVSILCDNVGDSVTFDAQGFGFGFYMELLIYCATHGINLSEKKEKIKNIAAYKDKVTTLLFFFGKTQYIKTEGDWITTAHLLYYLIFEVDEDGNIVYDEERKTNIKDAIGDDDGNYKSDSFVGQHWSAQIFEGVVDALYTIIEALVIKGILIMLTKILATTVATSFMSIIMTAFGSVCTWISGLVAPIIPLWPVWGPIAAWVGYEIINALASKFSYAQGGFPETGQPFIAREAGPELVGTIQSRNAVVNNDQIVESVSRGVYGAFMSALDRENSKAIARVYLDGKQIAMA